MIALEQTVAVLLCAGHSRRFESGDKLLFPMSGKPLAAHAAAMLATLPFAGLVATVRHNQTALHDLLKGFGFDLIEVTDDAEQSQSANAGIEAALAKGGKAICMMLGDMPFVPTSHIGSLAMAASDALPAASQGDGWIGPPWIASAMWLGANAAGVKAAIARDAVVITPPPGSLRDIDYHADLQAGP
jgi:molybdenum cofactor cytidylyltransferase